MTTQRKRPAGRKAATTRPDHKATGKSKKQRKQRAFTLQNPVRVRSPILRNKRRPKRKTTLTVGSVLVAIVTVTAYVVVGVVAAVVTGLITGVATGIAAARSEPDPPKQPSEPAGGKTSGRRPTAGKQPAPGTVMCAAPTRDNGRCMRFTALGQNCGIPGHPPPSAPAKRSPAKRVPQQERAWTASTIKCGAPTSNGPCTRPLRSGRNCGVEGHPVPGERAG